MSQHEFKIKPMWLEWFDEVEKEREKKRRENRRINIYMWRYHVDVDCVLHVSLFFLLTETSQWIEEHMFNGVSVSAVDAWKQVEWK